MNKINIFFTTIILLSSFIKSQEMVQEFLNGPIKDTEQLIEGYMSPFGKWFGTGLNAGWYNTAQSHQFPGFDVTGGIHLIQPPESAMLFTPTLNNLIVNSTNQELSTFIGPSNNTEIGYNNDDGEFQTLFNAPGGVINGKDPIPMPYIQGSIGLIKKTEILFRLTPPVKSQDLQIRYWGIGVKHDIKQWIPGVKILPFDLSVIAAYSQLNSNLTFNADQDLNFDVNAFNSNLIISKKILGFTPYVGLGYQYSKSILSLTGEYTILDWNGTDIDPGEIFPISDPIDISFGGVNGLKATLGARLKLLLFTFHIEWTKAEYDVFTIGIGLNSDIGSKLIGGSL
tara:strand:- start:6006 stop:7025 length:1020 start_codon:yes stop_codon:yes gene_type:complete